MIVILYEGMTMNARVEPVTVEVRGKPQKGFHVVTPQGRVANGFLHKTRKSAARHAEILNCFIFKQGERNID